MNLPIKIENRVKNRFVYLRLLEALASLATVTKPPASSMSIVKSTRDIAKNDSDINFNRDLTKRAQRETNGRSKFQNMTSSTGAAWRRTGISMNAVGLPRRLFAFS